MTAVRTKLATAILMLVCFCAFSANAFALDKRLKLMFKTAGYGAAAGFVIGAGTTALGMGGFRNILMGTSAGMYAGIALAAYIVATPSEDAAPEQGRGARRPRGPYAPRKPVGPNDYEEGEEEDFKDHLPPRKDEPESRIDLRFGPERVAGGIEQRRRAELAFWTPLLAIRF
ncbi:MAG: hypothetical protein HY075_08950 [Deltaproteobacteria bacterium]|nr:hypothetical protein [Deltaproteobacteria bacterium]